MRIQKKVPTIRDSSYKMEPQEFEYIYLLIFFWIIAVAVVFLAVEV